MTQSNFHIFTACSKQVAFFNEENLRILAILGKTPAYAGIRHDDDDTPIEVSTKNPTGTASNATQCQGQLIAETSAVTRTVNLGE